MADQTTSSSDPFRESLHAIVDRWRMQNPRGRSIPRSVRKEINVAVREDNRRQTLDYQRARLDIEAAVRDHQHNMLVGYRPRVTDTPETWFIRQQQLAHQRLAVEQRINAESHLSVEDRGQAVTALSVAHHAPSVPTLPVFTPQPASGLQALRARVQARLSRFRVGLTGDREQRRLEQWEQVHRDRAEQAERLPGRAGADAVSTAHAVGLGDFGVWVSRDTYEQRDERLAQLETSTADQAARVSALEDIAAGLRADNERLNQSAAVLTTERDQLAAQLDAIGEPGPGENDTTSEQPVSAAATNLITVAHPKLGTPMPTRASNMGGAENHAATVAPSAADGLDL